MRISWKARGAIWAIVLTGGMGAGIASHAACPGDVFKSGDFEAGISTFWTQTQVPPTTVPTVLDTTGAGAGGSKSCAVFEQKTVIPPAVPPVPAGDIELRYNVDLKQPGATITETLTLDNIVSKSTLYLWMKQVQVGDPADLITVTLNGGPTALILPSTLSPNWSASPVSITVDAALVDKPVTLIIQAVTSTRTATPTLVLLGAVEFSATPLTSPSTAAVPFGPVSYVEDPSVAVVAGYKVPEKVFDLSTGAAPGFLLNGQNVFRFGGIGFPTLKCKLFAPARSGNGIDELSVVAGDPEVSMGVLAKESDANLQTSCSPKQIQLTGMPLGKLSFQSNIKAVDPPKTGTIFILDDLSMTYTSPALSALLTAVPEVLTDGNFDAGGAGPWTTAAAVAINSIVGPPPSPYTPCSTPNAATFKALQVPEITLSQTVDVPANPDLLRFWLNVPTTGDPADTFECLVKTGASTSALSLETTAGPGSGKYEEHTIDLAAYKGQTGVTFTFRARFGSGKAAKFSLDDVCLEVPYAAISGWSGTLSPTVTGPNAAPVHIVITTQGGDLTGLDPTTLQLRLAPEMPVSGTPGDLNTAGNYLLWPVTVVDPVTATADVFFTGSPYNGLCVDGIMNIGLEVSGTLIPATTPPPTFIVDTVPPVLLLDSGFGVSPTGAMSAGSLLLRDVYALINTSSNTSLPFIVAAEPASPMSCAITARFAEQLQPVDANGAVCAVTPSGFVASYALSDNALLTTTTDVAGLARLNGVVSNINEVGNTLATFTGGPTLLNASWAIQNVMTNGDDPWNIAVMPTACDMAKNPSKVIDGNGNPVPLAHALKLWWMYRVMAIFSQNTTAAQQTATPRFDWTLLPTNRPPAAELLPLQSSVWFQVWYAQTAAGSWTSLTGGWSQTNSFIDSNTAVSTVGTGVLLGQLLLQNRRDPQQGKYLRIALRGRDEAGNVQPDLTADPSLFDTYQVAYQDWTNGQNQGNLAVDTDLNVRLSHAKGNGVLRNFGSMARVPLPSLPEAQAGVYVGATVTIMARYPGQMSSGTGSVQVKWMLYEEGALVAQGHVVPNAGGSSFDLPQALLNPGNYANLVLYGPQTNPAGPDPQAFLHIGPDGVKNRLGDEGIPPPKGTARQREIHYMLVAQTVATVPAGVDSSNNIIYQSITDPTPASVEFSVYVRDAFEKVREEQPVRIYERK